MKTGLPHILLWCFWAIAAIGLFLFSYTQVDLSLTLSQVNIYQTIEKSFQYLGYYQRPIAAAIYLAIVGALFILYAMTIGAARKNTLSHKMFWRIVGVLVVVLVFAYPAFSYDMFNYMFTAKTVLLYHKDPYMVIPLQFTGVEPWLSFMHWTHLPSAYTPLWITLTLPAYLLGFGYFLGVMWNIKILVATFYIITTVYIGKILRILDPKHQLLGMTVFALNPIIIVETLVSGHNDIVMMGLAMAAFYLYLTKQRWASFFVLSLSIAAKLMTIFLLPVFFVGWQRKWALWAMVIGFVLVATQRELLGWYAVWLVPMIALLPAQSWSLTVGTGLTLGLLLTYAPFLYYGHYNPPVATLKLWLLIVPVAFSVIWELYQRRKRPLNG